MSRLTVHSTSGQRFRIDRVGDELTCSVDGIAIGDVPLRETWRLMEASTGSQPARCLQVVDEVRHGGG